MSAPIGHNSKTEELKDYLDKIENLENEKGGIKIDIAELYEAAKGKGHDVPSMKAIIKEKMMTADQKVKRFNKERKLDEMKRQIGFESTPLGEAAERRVSG